MNVYARKLLINMLVSLVVSGIFLVSAATLEAQDEADDDIALSVKVGFDAHYKAEYWVPVQATVSNEGPAFEGDLQVVVGRPGSGEEVTYTNPIALPTGSNKEQMFFVYLPGLTSDVTVHLVDDSGEIKRSSTSKTLRSLARDDLLYGVVSTDPAEFSALEQVTGGRSAAAVAYLSLDDLPAVPSGLNSLDVLILHNIDTSQLSIGQLESIASWLDVGGQVVVTGGIGWQETISNLPFMLPVTIIGTETWADLPSMVSVSGIPLRDPGPYLVTNSFLTDGEAIFIEEGTPLLARRDIGLGSVYFLALDPVLPPMKDWDGSDLIWSEIANAIPELPIWGTGATNGYSATNAVTSLPSLTLPSGIELFLYLLLYIVIIGPINYVLLSRYNRRELAWLTIPSLVLIFSIIAYLVGFNLKGDTTLINQLSIAYGHINGDHLRVQSLLGIYSPSRDTYKLTLPGETTVRPFSQTFRGLTGGGNIETIERETNLKVTGIRIDISDIETFVADSYQATEGLSADIDLILNDENFIFDIEVKNESNTEYEDITLLLGSTAVGLGDLSPGEAKSQNLPITAGIQPSLMSGSTVAAPQFGPSSSPLLPNYGTILGTSDFYNDREIYPRWQLLDSIGFDTMAGLPEPVELTGVTLIAWSHQEQIELQLNDEPIESAGTTLYFLEVPVRDSVRNANNVNLPIEFIDWRVIGNSGIQNPGITGYYFSPGWVEYEIAPWSQFSNFHVSELGILIEGDSSRAEQPSLQANLWNWESKSWDPIENFIWGNNSIQDVSEYLGPDTNIRVRLENNSTGGINVRTIQPVLIGDFG